MSTLGWGVIGIGNIVKGTIAPAMIAEPECELVAAVSRDQGRADEFAARFGARYAYTDYSEMLSNPDVDAVFIATPNSQHPDQVVAAAEAGKHVLCDKPLAIDVPEALRALEACERAGVTLGINFHNRHLPWVRDVSRIISEGRIGKVRAVQLHIGSGPREYDNWRADPDVAGLGSVHNVGVHGLDFLRVLLGAEPVEVTAMFDRAPGSHQVEMLAMLLIRFDNDALVFANCNEALPHPRNAIEIYGSEGRITGTGFTRSRSDGELEVLTEAGVSISRYPAPEAHRLCLAAFTHAVLQGETPDPSGVDGLRSVQLCAAIETSVEERRTVTVDYGPETHALTTSFDPARFRTIGQVISTARETLGPGPYTWASVGIGQDVTVSRDAVALNRLALVPRVMRDVSQIDTGSSILGVPISVPVFLAPVAALRLYDPGDALAAAQAATRVSTTAFCSPLVTSSWEEVAATDPGRHFFQLYVLGDRAWMADIAARVEAAGFAGICVTADCPVVGRRDRALEQEFVWRPPAEGPTNLAQHGTDPSYRTRLTWEDLQWLCEQTNLPVILKGVLTVEDALTAIDTGAQAIYVSNHGGRVVDHEVSAIEVLGEIAEAVDGRAEILVDSGFTRGAEVCKALALGARAVGIGRLQCWGLAVGGVDGLAHVLDMLRQEISTTMANIGCRNVDELDAGHVRWSFPAPPPV